MPNFVKVNYQAGVTKISAQNLNDIQDELIKIGNIVAGGGSNPPGGSPITNVDAKDVTFTPPVDMQSNNVQSAIEEVSSKAVKTVNGQAIVNNDISISLTKNNDNITFSAANRVYGTLDFMTTQEAQEIKNLFK